MPALLLGFLLTTVLIVFLLKASARAAGVVAVLAGLGVLFGLARLFGITPPIRGYSAPSPLMILLPSLIGALCALDLWSTWRKKLHPPPAPTAHGPA